MKRLVYSVLFMFKMFSIIEATDIVLTAPKSGTHWLIYSLSYLTNRNGFGDNRFSDLVDIDLTKPVIKHAHGMPLKDYKNTSDRLILLVRDFKENLPRSYHHNYKKILSDLLSDKKTLYINNLMAFDAWNPSKRILIFYEDLCLKPKESLEKILTFLEEDQSKLNDFIENIDYHKKRSVEYYNSNPGYGKALTQGNDLSFHKKRSPSWFIDDLEKILLEKYPHISKQYLTRYFELDPNHSKKTIE